MVKVKKRYCYFNPITWKLYMSQYYIRKHSLTRSDFIRIDLFFRILIVYHLRFLVLQISLLMFLPRYLYIQLNQFILIIMQVLTLYSPLHLKLLFLLWPIKLRLRLWITSLSIHMLRVIIFSSI